MLFSIWTHTRGRKEGREDAFTPPGSLKGRDVRRDCADCTRSIAPPYCREKKPLVRLHAHTHTHKCLFFFSSVVLFTGQRVNKAAVTFLWEASVTGRLTTINFRTGRGDSCKEKARRIRNGPGHHLSSGLASDTENSSVCVSVCVCVSE